MNKKKIKIINRWFLGGANRYDNSSVFRIETKPSFISKEIAIKILKENKLTFSDIDFEEKYQISSWELAIKTLLFLSDLPVFYYKEVLVEKHGLYSVFNIFSREIGFMVTDMALEIVNSGFSEKFSRKVKKIKTTSKRFGFNPILVRYIQAAEKRNIPYIILIRNPFILQLGYGSNQKRVWSALTSRTSRIGSKLTANKYVLNNLLKKLDIPVSEAKPIADEADIELFMKELKLPVVIKPADSSIGRGVSLNINTLSEAKKAYRIALRTSSRVIIESQIVGKYYRLVFIDSKMVACAKANPVKIIGNGRMTLKKLIDKENKKFYRQAKNKHQAFYKIEATKKLKGIVSSQGYHINSIIPNRKEIYLSFSGADGGEWVEDNISVHPENIKIIKRALKFINIDVSGVDVISPDISVPLEKNGGKIIEINSGPDTNIHANVNQGEKIIIEELIIDYLFNKKETGRIPIVSITGTNGKTTTSKLMSHILNDPKKWTVGVTTSDNKYINNELVARGDKSGFLSAQSLLMNPEIDIAILETCHILGIDKRGLGYDWSDVSVITNLTGDHIGTFCTRSKEDLFNIKSVVAKRTRNYLILNADDEEVVRMAKFTRAKVAYFSLKRNNKHILENIKEGTPVYYCQKGKIWEEKDRKKTFLADIKKIPITHKGKAIFNIQNCLGAIAATRLITKGKIREPDMRERLYSFGKTARHNPGRFNLIENKKFKVVIDYAHNADGYEKTIELAKKIKHKRFIGVIKSAGDRPDEFIKNLGKIAGRNFDQIIIKDPSQEKIRGRLKGEVCKLLKKGVREAGFQEKNISIIHDEKKAVIKALSMARKGDLVLIFAHDVDQVISIVSEFRPNK